MTDPSATIATTPPFAAPAGAIAGVLVSGGIILVARELTFSAVSVWRDS
jgi:hypothetical protein